MVTLHISEVDLARDLHSVLAQARQGVEVVIEEDHKPVAVLKASVAAPPGRKLRECIELAKEYEANLDVAPVPDTDFARDVQEGINARRDTFDPPAWE